MRLGSGRRGKMGSKRWFVRYLESPSHALPPIVEITVE